MDLLTQFMASSLSPLSPIPTLPVACPWFYKDQIFGAPSIMDPIKLKVRSEGSRLMQISLLSLSLQAQKCYFLIRVLDYGSLCYE